MEHVACAEGVAGADTELAMVLDGLFVKERAIVPLRDLVGDTELERVLVVVPLPKRLLGMLEVGFNVVVRVEMGMREKDISVLGEDCAEAEARLAVAALVREAVLSPLLLLLALGSAVALLLAPPVTLRSGEVEGGMEPDTLGVAVMKSELEALGEGWAAAVRETLVLPVQLLALLAVAMLLGEEEGGRVRETLTLPVLLLALLAVAMLLSEAHAGLRVRVGEVVPLRVVTLAVLVTLGVAVALAGTVARDMALAVLVACCPRRCCCCGLRPSSSCALPAPPLPASSCSAKATSSSANSTPPTLRRRSSAERAPRGAVQVARAVPHSQGWPPGALPSSPATRCQPNSPRGVHPG